MGRKRAIHYVQCRTYGHAWDEYFPAAPDIAPKVLLCWRRLCLRCERCTATRQDGIGQSGKLEKRSYKYPEDYRVAKADKPTLPQMRLFIVTQRGGKSNGAASRKPKPAAARR